MGLTYTIFIKIFRRFFLYEQKRKKSVRRNADVVNPGNNRKLSFANEMEKVGCDTSARAVATGRYGLCISGS